ncbi:unnamed protein product [Ectocarpus sp. 4 AP-2014]
MARKTMPGRRISATLLRVAVVASAVASGWSEDVQHRHRHVADGRGDGFFTVVGEASGRGGESIVSMPMVREEARGSRDESAGPLSAGNAAVAAVGRSKASRRTAESKGPTPSPTMAYTLMPPPTSVAVAPSVAPVNTDIATPSPTARRTEAPIETTAPTHPAVETPAPIAAAEVTTGPVASATPQPTARAATPTPTVQVTTGRTPAPTTAATAVTIAPITPTPTAPGATPTPTSQETPVPVTVAAATRTPVVVQPTAVMSPAPQAAGEATSKSPVESTPAPTAAAAGAGAAVDPSDAGTTATSPSPGEDADASADGGDASGDGDEDFVFGTRLSDDEKRDIIMGTSIISGMAVALVFGACFVARYNARMARLDDEDDDDDVDVTRRGERRIAMSKGFTSYRLSRVADTQA